MGGKPRSPAPGGVEGLVEAVRRAVSAMIDGVTAAPSADGRGLELRRRERFARIEPAGDEVRVWLDHGAALPDLGGALHGEGTARYVTIRSAADLSTFAVKTVLAAALYDDDTHGFRS